MFLSELEPRFIRREIRPCSVGQPGCSVVSPHTEHEYHVRVDTIAEADGVCFLCPKCWSSNAGPIGTHRVICWRPRVPAGIDPGPGRWEFVGTDLASLSLFAGSSSVALIGGCDAHFFIENGAIRMC